MSKKTSIPILILLVAIVAGFFVWRVQDTRAKSARIESEILKGLTAEEINLILKSQELSDVSGVAAIAEKAETRRAFLKGMREYLALAAEARREGLSEDPNFKTNLEYKKNILLTDLYGAELSKEQRRYVAPREDINAVWTNTENENQFNRDMDALRAIQMAVAKVRGDQLSFSKLQGESLMKARENWARTKTLSDKAKNDGEFMSRPEIQFAI